MWHSHEEGSGRPLILLHGIGMSHTVWRPVLPHLRGSRRVIAFDIAGFGRTPPLPDATPPTIANLVGGLAESLEALGIDGPVDIGGSSLGGTLALEAARRGLARTVVSIAPAGLWRRHGAPHVPLVFGGLRRLARHAPGLMRSTVRHRLLRELALAVPISAGSGRMAADGAVRAIDDLAAAHGFEATFAHTRAPFRALDIRVPITVAFGDRDWILTRGSRDRDALPPHTQWIERRGWGHVPMWIDPAGVARLLLDGSAAHDCTPMK